jgi:Kef-type K+ transport system membrane component KefB
MGKEVVLHVLLDVAVVVAVARLVGRLFLRVRQPAVIGEILGGILLGPSLLGLLPGDLHLVLFPPDVRPYLTVIAQLGLVLFMFIVGLEVDLTHIRSRRRLATSVSLSSIVLPFGLGVLLALVLYPAHDTVRDAPVSPVAFGLFLGVAMSITAFPVLARILTERRMHRTPVGVLALACAAIDDVVAWSLLAVVVAVAVGGTLGGVGWILALTVIYGVVMVVVVRPLLSRTAQRYRAAGRLTPDVLAVVLVGLLLSAAATEAIGIHAIFGAFAFGAIMPRTEPGLTRTVLERLEQVSLLLFLPVFFVVAGLQVDVRGVGLAGLGELGLILLVAIGGKFLGAVAAARLQRVPQRQAAALGVLMNTRGLTEIVILQIGAQLGVLDQRLFTLMVLMALITTVMTEPLLRRVYPDRMVRRDVAAAERAELGEADAFGVLVSVPDGTGADHGRRLADLASGLVGAERPARIVLVRLLPAPPEPLELASGLGPDLLAITLAGDELRRLAAPVTADGVHSQVLARFSDAGPADLAALAVDVRADVVVVPEPPEADGAAEVPDLGEAALAIVRPAEAGGTPTSLVHVLLDGEGGGRAALRLGGRLALHHGAAVAVGGTDDRRSGRRATVAVAALRRLGIDATGFPADRAPDVLVLPVGCAEPPTAPTTTVVRVRPASSDVDEDLGQVLARIPVQ